MRSRSLRPLGLLVLLALGAGCSPPHSVPSVVAFDPDTVPDAYSRASAALMWPGATRAVLVDSLGDLWNGAWLTRVNGMVDGTPLPPPRTIAYEDRWCPVAHWRRHVGEVLWDFEAVALPAPAWHFPGYASQRFTVDTERSDRKREAAVYAGWRPDHVDSLILGSPRKLERLASETVGLVVSMEIRITNRGTTAKQVLLSAAFEPPGPVTPFIAADAKASEPVARNWAPGSDGSVIGWSGLPHQGAQTSEVAALGPGETRIQRIALSTYPMSAAALTRWARVPHAQRAAEARLFWRRRMDHGTSFELGDHEMEDAIRAARVVLLACTEWRGGHMVPLGNPFQYRDVWIRDGARAVQALAVHGYTQESRDMALTFRELQWPNGSFASQRGQLDATGQALWAYEQTMLRPSPGRNVASLADDAWLAWEWYERVRHRASGGSEGPPGMMPAADPNDNEMVRAPLVGNDAWGIGGYRAAARLLRAAGRGAQAARVEASLATYSQEFAAALDHVRGGDIPPSWEGGGYDWGNLAAVYPCGALPADAPRAAALALRYWARGGGAGLGHYYTDARLMHGYVGADLGTWALLAGWRPSADSVLVALLHWRSASGGAGETFSRETRDYGTNLPPHATSAAALLSLVRNCVIFDDGDRLELTLGARARWWEHGVIRRAPTRFGLVDLEFSCHGGTAEWRWTPVSVPTELTLPPGMVLAEGLRAPLALGRHPGVIEAPPGTGHVRVSVRRV